MGCEVWCWCVSGEDGVCVRVAVCGVVVMCGVCVCVWCVCV